MRSVLESWGHQCHCLGRPPGRRAPKRQVSTSPQLTVCLCGPVAHYPTGQVVERSVLECGLSDWQRARKTVGRCLWCQGASSYTFRQDRSPPLVDSRRYCRYHPTPASPKRVWAWVVRSGQLSTRITNPLTRAKALQIAVGVITPVNAVLRGVVALYPGRVPANKALVVVAFLVSWGTDRRPDHKQTHALPSKYSSSSLRLNSNLLPS